MADLNPNAPTLSRMGKVLLPEGAITLASNKIFANLYDPDNPSKDVSVHFAFSLS
jgi:hypothetical protein